MLHAELGRRALYTNIQNRMMGLGYQLSMVRKINYQICYSFHINESNNGKYVSKWIQFIKYILISVGKPNLVNATFFDRPKHIKKINKNTINDLYIQEWNAKIQASSKGKNYSIYKIEMGLERYLLDLCSKFCFPLCRYRTGNRRLPVETGRWANIPLDERKCTLCDQDIGDEYHYLFTCPYFANDREEYLKSYFFINVQIF